MSRGTLDSAAAGALRLRGFHPLWPAFPKPFCLPSSSSLQSSTRRCTHRRLASSAFARRYLRNRCFFLFLRLLRCFSSPGSPPWVIYWPMDDRGSLCRVSPFRHLRLSGYLPLPAAFRSLSRLSSALSAKASALCPFLFDLFSPLYSVTAAVRLFIAFLMSFYYLLSEIIFFQYAVFKVQFGGLFLPPGCLTATAQEKFSFSVLSLPGFVFFSIL